MRLEVVTRHPGHAQDVMHRFLDIAMASPEVELKIISEFQHEPEDPE